MKQIAVIGGGAAGMMAALTAAQPGWRQRFFWAKKIIRYIFLRKMKSLEKRYISQERDAAM